MSEPFLAMITPVGGGAEPPKPPAVWPPPGQPGHPLPPEGTEPPEKPPGYYPPGHPDHPLPEPPPTEGEDGKPGIWPPTHKPGNPLPPILPIPPDEKPPQPPGTIWPPIDGMEGDAVILVWVPFVGFRWVVIDFDERPTAPDQPPQPK